MAHACLADKYQRRRSDCYQQVRRDAFRRTMTIDLDHTEITSSRLVSSQRGKHLATFNVAAVAEIPSRFK